MGVLDSLPKGYRWATTDEVDMLEWRGDKDQFVKVIQASANGGTERLAVPEGYRQNDLPTSPSGAPLPLISAEALRNQRCPAGLVFAWGPIDKVHAVGPYKVVEFRADVTFVSSIGLTHGLTYYHPVLTDVYTLIRHETLDEALLCAIAHSHEGKITQAASYFMKMIGAAA
ncbi:hypothetical protein OG474_30620 [Kribbella sp. NBC_01505]|uniref:hypothetical protein n=1 Tax=Kribbella sp. NBC_01505 TaxID=2903580 RepID=UPI00386E5EB7